MQAAVINFGHFLSLLAGFRLGAGYLAVGRHDLLNRVRRSVRVGGFGLQIRVTGFDHRLVKGRTRGRRRITSYNVCYTKLLR